MKTNFPKFSKFSGQVWTGHEAGPSNESNESNGRASYFTKIMICTVRKRSARMVDKIEVLKETSKQKVIAIEPKNKCACRDWALFRNLPVFGISYRDFQILT